MSDWCIDVSMFGTKGTGLSGDWNGDVLLGISDNVLFDGAI